MAKTAADLWGDCLQAIHQRVTDTQYTSFFHPITFEAYDRKTRTLLLQVPNRQLIELLEGRFASLLGDILAAHFGQIHLQYRNTETITGEASAVSGMLQKPSSGITIATHLNPHYTFTTFIEGESNKLARSVGLTIAEHPRKTNFNPLFVYGPSGCGKTHLLNAIGNRTCELYPRKKVIYVDAREFQFQYTNSVATNKINEFLQNYYLFDMLIVDDVQEWEGRRGTSETFFHIFNHLFMSGKHIILAADRTPAELRNLDERMLTRFSCGIMTELGKPNPQLCYDILQAKIRRDGLVIPAEAVEYIANHANGSVRDLEGVINSLLAYSTFIRGDIDMSLVTTVVGRLQRAMPQRIDTSTVINTVAAHYKLTAADLVGASRKHELVVARQVAMYLLHHVAKINVNQIGRLLGNRNHATVSYGIQSVAATAQSDKEFARELQSIEREVTSKKK